MSKYFVDPQKKIPATPLSLYNYGIRMLEKAEIAKDVGGLLKEAQSGYHAVSTTLREALLFGQVEAAAALAYLYCHGYGVEQDYNKVKLYIIIGNNLGETITSKFMRGENDETLDIQPFLQTRPVYSRELINQAEEYCSIISENAFIYGNNSEITKEKLAQASAIFEAAEPRLLNVFDVEVSSVASNEAWSTINWKNAGAAKVTDIKDSEGVIYGQIYDQDITKQFNFIVNGYPVTIVKYRSITMPDQIQLGETFNYSFALKEPGGLNISKSDAAYLEVQYNSYGQLVKLSVPSEPAISHNDPYAPAIVVYHNKVYTLPVSSGHYWHLKKVVESNSGAFEIQDPGPVPEVEHFIHEQYQPMGMFQQNDHYVPISGVGQQQVNGEDCCCILM